jgi:hypothetical protein
MGNGRAFDAGKPGSESQAIAHLETPQRRLIHKTLLIPLEVI